MATWRDGPEYAPLERPDAYDEPAGAHVLAAEPAAPARDDAPREAPADYQDAPGPDLAAVAVEERNPRDPRAPYEVATSALAGPEASATSSGSAWGATHYAPPPLPSPFAPTQPLAPQQQWAPPSGAPAGTPAPYPQPGTPGWFAPPGAAAPAGQAGRVNLFTAMTPGVWFALVLGSLIPVVSPLLYLVGFAFSLRMKVAKAATSSLFVLGLVVIGLVGVIALLLSPDQPDAVWGVIGWTSLVASICTLIGAIIASLQAQRRGERP